MMRRLARGLCAMLALLAFPALASAQVLDETPRTVVMTAFPPEYQALVGSVAQPVAYHVNGLTLLTGTIEGHPVVLMQSGVSMVNAAMNTQMVFDRFRVRRIVFSGIAGGVDPALAIGDVIVPAQWGQYLEVAFARRKRGKWVPPEPIDAEAPRNWGMMFPRGVRVGNATAPSKRRYLLDADPALLDLARAVAARTTLRRCLPPAGVASAASNCLTGNPKVVVGGIGVSAGVFADNAEFRTYLHSAWKARVLDMESAAVVQVAYANGTPAIVFRSLSDLAGGDAGANQMDTFIHLASVNSADVVRAFVAALPD